MTQSLEKEIGSLRSLFWSERDPEGCAFAPLADAYGRAGDFKKAMDLLAEGIGRHPGFSTGHVVAARLYLEKGLIAEAEIAVDSALELDGDNVVALAALAEIREVQGESEEAERVRARLRSLESATEEAGDPEEAPGIGPLDAFLDITDLATSEGTVEQPRSGPVASTTEPIKALPAELERPAEEESKGSWLDVAFPDLVEPAEEVPPLDSDERVADALDLEPEGPVVDMFDLLPTEPVTDVLDLAPDEPVADVLDLAPAEPVAAVPVPEDDEPVVDVLALAPDEPEAEVVAVAPVEPVVNILDLAPDETVLDVHALRPDGLGGEHAGRTLDHPTVGEVLAMDELVDTEPVLTRTMAELYLEQGLTDRALRVYRGLLAENPEDDELRGRIAGLERGDQAAPARHGGADEHAEWADPTWDAEAQAAPHDVDTPFAWTDDEGEQSFTGPAIGTFFDKLLAWQPGQVPDRVPQDDEGPGLEEEGRDS